MTILLALATMTCNAQSASELNRPFGFCTVASRTDKAARYDISGGGGYIYNKKDGSVTDSKGHATPAQNIKVLKATDVTCDDDIKNAVFNNSVVVFDGSAGDFIVNSVIDLRDIANKTLIGINNARLCTKFYVTPEIRKMIHDAGAEKASTSGGGGKLISGAFVKEEAEYLTRKTLIEKLNDEKELFRNSGVFRLQGNNIIIRNIKFVGPGSIDVGGSDLLTVSHAKNVWVDHCEFTDGMDGNFDIVGSSDFVTVSWCKFCYTERSYMHQNTNLVGASDREALGFLNTTYAYNMWGKGCKQRMPMARVGKIHMLNNFYDCDDSNLNLCINPRANSEFLIEGNYFAESLGEGKLIKIHPEAKACTIGKGNVANQKLPESSGDIVQVPYDYKLKDATKAMKDIKKNVGATLW